MPVLNIRLFGDFQIMHGEESLSGLATMRPQSVLTYLLLHRQAPQPRQHVAVTLWPDSAESQARTNLRKYLHHLRRALPDVNQFLSIDGNNVQWRPNAPFALDVAEFEQVVETAQRATEDGDFLTTRRALQKAVEHYQGDLLPGCYDDWILAPRERLSRMYVRAMDQLVQLFESQRDYATSIRYAQRLLRHDPLRETAYRRLMRLHALNGDRAKALQTYHRCATLLERELDAEPSQTTQATYERLLGAKHVATAPTLAQLAATVPLVGRKQPWALLQAAWRSATHRGPHFALVSGEAGIGKTRLAEELLVWAERQGIAVATTRSFAVEGPLAYAPVIGWLRTDTLQQAITQLEDIWLTELARLLPELLSQRPSLPHPEPLNQSWQRQRLFEAISRAVLAVSQPLLLFIDDLQWSDEQTLAWLHFLLRFDSQAQLLIIGAMRPEEIMDEHPLPSLLMALHDSRQLTEINLAQLDEAETGTLARHMTGHKLDSEQKARLYHETEGNPLFIVEKLRASLPDFLSVPPHHQPHEIPQAIISDTLPPKVQAVIEHRLGQLSAEGRALVEVAAVVGRQFTFDVVAKASDQEESVVVKALDELWHRRIVRQQDGDFYNFSHDKIREVTYLQLSPARRHYLHGRVAEALEAVAYKNLDELASDLARHYTVASRTEKAVTYRLAAGERALALSAHQEATRHLRKGLALLETLPETAERDQSELVFRMALGSAMILQKGYAAPEVRQTYNRAAKLVWRLGEEAQLIPVLYGLGQYYLLQEEGGTTRALAEHCLYLAQNRQDPNDLLLAHGLMGFVFTYMGWLAKALEHLEQSLTCYKQLSNPPTTGTDLEVMCRCHRGLVLWALGYPKQSLEEMAGAIERANDLAHPHSLAAVLSLAGSFHFLRREPKRAQIYAEKAITMCVAYKFPHWHCLSLVVRGWALAQNGKFSEGITEARHGLEIQTSLGVRQDFITRTMLADIYACLEDVDNGLSAVDEALASAAVSAFRCYESIALRIKGRLLELGNATSDEIEACYQQALDVAQAQEGRSFELQATMALCRLWEQQDRQAEARALLTNTYNWFSEGFDTPDLKAARALLEELA